MPIISVREEITRITDPWKRCDKRCFQWDKVIEKCNQDSQRCR